MTPLQRLLVLQALMMAPSTALMPDMTTRDLDQPEKPDKGLLDGACNRRACQKPGARWYNHSTERHYCAKCARQINDANHFESMRLFGHPLCTEVPDPR